MKREKLKSILKDCLKDPKDLDRIRIVEENGEYWVEWEEYGTDPEAFPSEPPHSKARAILALFLRGILC